MSYRTLLAVIDSAAEQADPVDAAIALALPLEAHVAALAIAGQPSLDYGAGVGFGTEVILSEMQAAREEAETRAKSLGEAISRAGVSGEHRHAARSFAGIADEVGRQGRLADLVLFGRDDTGSIAGVPAKIADGALFETGRPALMIPPGWGDRAVGRRIAIAWDLSREASRAVASALPLIAGADRVSVALADPEPGTFGDEPGADIAVSLSRHNSAVAVDRLPGMGRSVAETLIGHATDMDADLIVLGAYGHARLTEALFGGVTRDMMKTSPLPLLLAH